MDAFRDAYGLTRGQTPGEDSETKPPRKPAVKKKETTIVSIQAKSFLSKVFPKRTVNFPSSFKQAVELVYGKNWRQCLMFYAGQDQIVEGFTLFDDLERGEDGRIRNLILQALRIISRIRAGEIPAGAVKGRTAKLYAQIDASDDARWQIIEATVANWFEHKD